MARRDEKDLLCKEKHDALKHKQILPAISKTVEKSSVCSMGI